MQYAHGQGLTGHGRKKELQHLAFLFCTQAGASEAIVCLTNISTPQESCDTSAFSKTKPFRPSLPGPIKLLPATPLPRGPSGSAHASHCECSLTDADKGLAAYGVPNYQ